MKIDVIIPNYNGFSLLEKNLPKVLHALSYPKTEFSIIIVDDYSKNDDFQNLERLVAKLNKSESIPIKLLRNHKNFGFSTTVNNGVKTSIADFVLLLNSDAIPQKNFLDPLIDDFLKEEKLFGVGCMDESIEGDTVVLRGRGEGSFQRGFLVHRKGDIEKGPRTLWISGGSSLVRRELFEKIAGFDTIYNPFYWEDIDLSYRAQKSGYTVMFDKRSRVTHIHSEGAIKKNFKKSYITKIVYRNQFIFVWKNMDTRYLLYHILWLPYHMIKAILRTDKAFFVGFILALKRFPDIIAKRKRQKKIFILSDKDILSS